MNQTTTEGCLEKIMLGSHIKDPVVQILKSEYRKGRSRYMCIVVISDGLFLTNFGFLSCNLHGLVTSGKLQNNSLVILHEYFVLAKGTIHDKYDVLLIRNLSILEKGSVVGRRIGNPITYPLRSVSAFLLKGKSESVFRPLGATTSPIVALNSNTRGCRIKARVVQKEFRNSAS